MKKQPNIIIIIADDLGCCDLGYLGNEMAITPNIDRLAATGCTFSHHYSASPMCAPARAGLLCGKYPHKTGATDVPPIRGMNRVNPNETTLPGLLKSVGYRTGLIGKWHNGGGHADFHPCHYGYDFFCGFESGVSQYYNYTLEREFGNIERVGDSYITDRLTDEAIDFITRCTDSARSHSPAPFHLQLAYNAPHRPLVAPPEDVALFEKYDTLTEGLKTLYAMVKRMDDNIGRLMMCLEERGVSDNTLILFLSDNGPDFVGKGDMAIADRPNHRFRGHKGDTFDGGTRVPAILNLPGIYDGGRVIDEVTSFTDWLPTLAHIGGVETEAIPECDGRDLIPLFDGGSVEKTDLYWQWTRYRIINRSNMAVLSGDYKLVYPAYGNNLKYNKPDSPYSTAYGRYTILLGQVERDIPGDDVKPMLFNIRNDPEETEDLSSVMPDTVTRLSGLLDRWYVTVTAEYEKASAFTLINPD